MTKAQAEIIVAGHICLDLIPGFAPRKDGIANLLAPGKLLIVEQCTIGTGGPVSNTGLALHRLGMPVTLMGKIGNDLFGKGILQVLSGYGDELAAEVKRGKLGIVGHVKDPVDRGVRRGRGAAEVAGRDQRPAGVDDVARAGDRADRDRGGRCDCA